MNVILPLSVLKCIVKFVDDYPFTGDGNDVFVTLNIIDSVIKSLGGRYEVSFNSDKEYVKLKTNYEKLPAE